MLQTFQSSSAAERLGAASAFVARFPTATEVLIVGAVSTLDAGRSRARSSCSRALEGQGGARYDCESHVLCVHEPGG
jgi:hypothetical protein